MALLVLLSFACGGFTGIVSVYGMNVRLTRKGDGNVCVGGGYYQAGGFETVKKYQFRGLNALFRGK
ncbi:hypothetical protein CK934_21635 [Chitinophaga sp. MD30]|nr:hypothetical protein CK934_21635 [Chitinophaga sp. MD30]